MADFDDYVAPSIPTTVSHISFNIRSEFIDDVETEYIDASAVVVDQNGQPMKIHTATDYQELIAKGVMTAQQLQNIQSFLQDVRDTIEGKLLP
jgi:hypothetical protein